MTWSESGYEQTDKPQNKLKRQSDKVYSATDFLSKFEGNQNNIVSACMKEMENDNQLKSGFDNLLKSGISNDLINKIKQELEEGIKFGIDDVTLKDSIQGIIAENIENFKIGSTVFEGTLNQMNQDKETAAKDKETAAKNKETAAQDKETAKDMVQKVKDSKDICLDYRTQLLVGHDDVKEKTEKKAEIAQQQLPEETKNKLKEKGYDDKFINDYILLRVTLNEVKNDSSFDKNQVAQFEKGVNELSTIDAILKSIDNACNIPDTSLSSFSTENIAQTRTELFNEDIGNDSLISAKKSNMESHDYSEIFPEKIEADELIAKYGNFLEGNLKTFWQNYKNNPNEIKNKVNKIKDNPNPTDEDKRFLQIYNYMIAELDKKRKETEEQTKNMMEELCIISQIKGMYMCMGEGADFNLNKAREIESEDGILTLRGHIDGVDFAIRQDTNNPEARLQTSQKLAKSTDGNTFSIGGKDKDNFVDSNFILPSQDEILDSIKETVTLKSSLENFDNPADYLENLQSNIMGDIDEKYKDTEYVHHYMQGQVGGEKIIDNTLGLINNAKQNITDDETLMKGINQSTNKDLFDFMKILKFNIDNSTNAEKDNLNKCITKIIEITDNYKNTNGVEDFVSLKYPPVIENYLKDKAWLNGGNEDSRLKMLSDLFKFYSEKSRDTRLNSEGNNGGTPSKMIINDLYRDLFEFQGGGKSEVASSRDMEKKLQSNNTIAWQESEDADLILANWPEG